jgi:hypothetical protein
MPTLGESMTAEEFFAKYDPLHPVRYDLAAPTAPEEPAAPAPPRHYTSDYLETGDYNGAISDLRREILDDASTRLAKEFKGDAAEARRALKGADISGHPAGRQKRIEKARVGYQRRLSDLSGSDKEARRGARELEKDSVQFNERFGPRLLPEEKPDGS